MEDFARDFYLTTKDGEYALSRVHISGLFPAEISFASLLSHADTQDRNFTPKIVDSLFTDTCISIRMSGTGTDD